MIAIGKSYQKYHKNPIDILDNLDIKDGMDDMNTIIFLGGTGAGKSTIINLLAGIKLVVNNSDSTGRKQYVVDKQQTSRFYTKIGQTLSSQTYLPKYVLSTTDKNTAFYDTAGFLQSRGYQCEVINQYGVDLMFNITSKIKVIIVIDEISLKNDMLKSIVKQLGLQDIFSDSIGLIINKVQTETTQQMLVNLIIQKISQLDRKGLEGVNIIRNSFVLDNYAILSTPQRVITMKTTLQKQKQKILKMINRMSFSETKHIKKIFKFGLDYRSQVKIQKVKGKIYKKYLNLCVSKVVRDLLSLKIFQEMNKIKSPSQFQQVILSKIKQKINEKSWSSKYFKYKHFFKYLDSKTKLSNLLDKFNQNIYHMMMLEFTQRQKNSHKQQQSQWYRFFSQIFDSSVNFMGYAYNTTKQKMDEWFN